MAKVLILGGTGAIGAYLAPELLAQGHQVAVTSRSPGKSNHPHLRYLYGSARDRRFVQEITTDTKYDAIVDLMLYSTPEFREAHQGLLGATGQYLFVSTYRVFADTGLTPITEQCPRLLDVCQDADYLATDEYALTKARQEDLLRASGKGNWTILRPCITYSKNRFQFGTLEANTLCYRALQGVPVLMASDILSKVTTMTWAGDSARLIAGLVGNEKACGEDYNISTSEHQTWREIAGIYRRAIGLQIVECDVRKYASVVGGTYQIKYDRMLNRMIDNRKVLDATGYSQSELTPLSNGLAKELESFKKNPIYKHHDILLNARLDRETGSSIRLTEQPFHGKTLYFLEKYFRLGHMVRGVLSHVRHFLQPKRGAR
jgi:nucleoside-diphosphate-sugar epimerase